MPQIKRNFMDSQAEALGAFPLARPALREAVRAANSEHGLQLTAQAAGAPSCLRLEPVKIDPSHIFQSDRAVACRLRFLGRLLGLRRGSCARNACRARGGIARRLLCATSRGRSGLCGGGRPGGGGSAVWDRRSSDDPKAGTCTEVYMHMYNHNFFFFRGASQPC